jgi:hypothetical protein
MESGAETRSERIALVRFGRTCGGCAIENGLLGFERRKGGGTLQEVNR